MLVVLGNITEFRNVVRYLGQSLNFNKKRAMSLFELNIRALGGLLSGHHFAEQVSYICPVIHSRRVNCPSTRFQLKYRTSTVGWWVVLASQCW